MVNHSPSREGEVVGGRFRLDLKVRQGVGATLYSGRDLLEGGPIAAWILDGAAHHGADFIERTAFLEGLASPYLAALIAALLTTDGVPVLIEAPIEGESLVERLARAPLSLREALNTLDLLLSGLADCHLQGIVHCDVRPENVFLKGSGDQVRVQLRGAGYASLFSEQSAPSIGGIAYGNPLFTAPEQWVNRNVDPATDLYAVAGLAYLMLSGAHFISAGPPFAVCRQHFTAPRPMLDRTALGEVIPEALAAVLVRAASAERAQRFASADDFQTALLESGAECRPNFGGPKGDVTGFDITDISFNIDVSILNEITMDAGISRFMVEECTGTSTAPPSGVGDSIDYDDMPDDTLDERPSFLEDE